jgi:alkylhydroperoxidase family enzyme
MRLAVARQEGLEESTIGAVFRADTASFPPHQQAALALADALMTQPSALTDAAVAELHRHFTVEQLIELTLDVMKWNYQKVAVALGTDAPMTPGAITDLVFDEQGNFVR